MFDRLFFLSVVINSLSIGWLIDLIESFLSARSAIIPPYVIELWPGVRAALVRWRTDLLAQEDGRR